VAPKPAGGPAADIESIRTLWPAVLETVKSIPSGGRTAWTVFADSVPTGVNGDALVVALSQQGPYTVARSRNLDEVLAAAVAQVVKRPLRVDLVLDQGAKPPQAAAPAVASVEVSSEVPEASPLARAEATVAAEPVVDLSADVPSEDDENADDALRGIELAKQTLGGTIIGESDRL